MNSTFPQNSLRFLYFHYKNSLAYLISLILGIFIVCFLLIFYVIIPQYQQWFSIQSEVADTQRKIAVINQNIHFVSALDQKMLDSQLQLATQALPSDKDFQSILAVLSDAALAAGVQFEDYSFHVGSLTSSAQDPISPDYRASILQLTISVDGDLTKTQEFVKTIEHRLPLSAISSLHGDAHSTTLIIQFLNKPFGQIAYHDEEALTPVDQQESRLLKDLSTWKISSASVELQLIAPVATSGSIPVF